MCAARVRRESSEALFMQYGIRLKKGGRGTRARMKCTYRQVVRFGKLRGWHGLSPLNITADQTREYIKFRLEEEITARVIQSEVSAIRRALYGAGRTLECKNLFTSELLGVPKASSIGKGIAISDQVYFAALEKADRYVAALMQLQYHLGLRLNEAIQCKNSLRSWEYVMRIGGAALFLTFGAKGGRHRVIFVHPEKREVVYAAIVAVLASTSGGKNYPMPTAKTGEKAAQMYRYRLARLGIIGVYSSHSMRRRFAVDQYLLYVAAGYESKIALSRIALDLGHGEGRGRWVWNNYLSQTLPQQS